MNGTSARALKRLLHSIRFYISLIIVVATPLAYVIIRLQEQRSSFSFTPMYISQLFSINLISMAVALLISTSDSVSREREKETLSFLSTLPVSAHDITLGKFTGILTSASVFSSLNTIVFSIVLYQYTSQTTYSYLVNPQLVLAYFSGILLFLVAIGGITLLFSTLIKKSSLVSFAVIGIYLLLNFPHSQALLGDILLANPAIFFIRQVKPLLLILFITLGYFGYDLVPSLLNNFKVSEPQMLTKYLHLHMDAGRVFRHTFEIENITNITFNDAILSGLALITISISALTLSTILIKRNL